MTKNSNEKPVRLGLGAGSDSRTLLELTTATALSLAAEEAESAERLTTNLHPLATRALFQATLGLLTNQQLLSTLRPSNISSAVGRDTREARFLRSKGDERGLKIGDLRRHAVSLLTSRSVPKADIARAWAYAIINSAALETVRHFRTRDPSGRVSLSAYFRHGSPSNELMNHGYDLTVALLRNDFQEATLAAEQERPAWEERRFLHYAASLVIETMDVDRPGLAGLNDLVSQVYPAIEEYKFEQP